MWCVVVWCGEAWCGEASHYSTLTSHHSPLPTHYSPLNTHHSPLTTHNTRHSLCRALHTPHDLFARSAGRRSRCVGMYPCSPSWVCHRPKWSTRGRTSAAGLGAGLEVGVGFDTSLVGDAVGAWRPPVREVTAKARRAATTGPHIYTGHERTLT